MMARGESFLGETERIPPEVLAGLAARGVGFTRRFGEGSGFHGVVLDADGRVEGAADRRREGVWRQP